MRDAWSLACAIDQPECWHELVAAALYHLDIELGTPEATICTCDRGYHIVGASQQLKDIGMVNSLGQILVCVCMLSIGCK